MDESLQIALTITVIGMTLLFLSLILFWGLITLLTAVVKDKPASPAQQVAAEESGKAREGTGAEARARHRAAAVAVVLARAQAEGRSSPAVAPVAAGTPADRRVSAWWSLHHQRRLGPNPEPKRNR